MAYGPLPRPPGEAVQPVRPAPPVGPQPVNATDGVAIAALVLGILALFLSIIPFGLVLGVPMAIAAIVCAVIGIRRKVQRGLAIGGLTTAILAIVVSIAYAGVFFFVVRGDGGAFAVGDEFRVDEATAMELTDTSPCVESSEVAGFASGQADDGVTVHQIEACQDFDDSFLFGIELENTTDQPLDVTLILRVVSGATTTEMGSDEFVFLEPGQRGWYQVVTFDEFQAPDDVTVTVNVQQF